MALVTGRDDQMHGTRILGAQREPSVPGYRLSEKFEPVEEQVSGNGDFAKRCRNCVVSGRTS